MMSRKYADKPLDYKIRKVKNKIRRYAKYSQKAYKKNHNILGVIYANKSFAYERKLESLLRENAL